MSANPIQQALAQVQELQKKILEKQRFKGYSGRARAICGTLALAAAAVMSSSLYPQTIAAHATGWVAFFLFSLLLNFGAVLYWYLFDPSTKRELRTLKPVLDIFPSLLIGGIFTLVFIREGLFQYLFGAWLCFFGLSDLATRHVLPRAIWMIGVYYILWGITLLLIFPISFLNPWPLAVIFFIGEWCGGVILHFDEMENFSSAWNDLLGRGKKHAEV